MKNSSEQIAPARYLVVARALAIATLLFPGALTTRQPRTQCERLRRKVCGSNLPRRLARGLAVVFGLKTSGSSCRTGMRMVILEKEHDGKGKEKLVTFQWHDAPPREGYKPVVPRLCEIFPKLTKHRCEDRDNPEL